ncbi:hypothetical protein IJI31_06370 [bacterium]|nr:hypothetical protein [bacterium]
MRKFILIASLLLITQQYGCAEVLNSEVTTPEYLINSGYSTEMAEMVNYQKSMSLGEEFNSIKPVQYSKRNKFCRFWRRCLEYIDPALDDDKFYYHDIITEPKVTDF